MTPYLVATDGAMVAELPDRCPLAATTGPEGCAIGTHDRRRRKTGPEFPLTVAVCRNHGQAFTLYPPGYAPYRRQALVRVAPDGSAIQREGCSADRDFDDTLFAASQQARDGEAWARESGDEAPDRWWSTQGRHLRLGARIVGIARDLTEHVRERIAGVLDVDLLALRERIPIGGYRHIGRAVSAVLDHLAGGCRRARRLLVCGHLVGSWGEPLHWDHERRVLERSPICAIAATTATPSTS